MKLSDFSRRVLSISVAASLLAGCGGSQPPIGAPGAMPQSHAIATRAARATSWMLPEAVSQDLLYVSNVRTVTVYAYPQGELVGKLGGFYRAVGECVDQQGDVFITNQGTNQIFEYAHGSKTRKRALTGGGAPTGCSADLSTGNLAVANYGGSVGIYKNSRGKPKLYKDSSFKEYFFCGYDNSGNLFVDGVGSSGSAFQFAELPKGGSALQSVTLDRNITAPGGVQWDGKYVAVEDNKDQTPVVIHRFRITKGSGHEVGSTSLGNPAFFVLQFWIQGRALIAPNACCRGVGQALFYTYPSGGKPTKTIVAGINYPNGAVVSLAPNR
jgi:hypothetical protein